MQRKRSLKCPASSRRFTGVAVGSEFQVSHHRGDVSVGRSFEEAMGLALPDKGNHVGVYVVCGKESGEARMNLMNGKGELIRLFKSHGWQYPKRAAKRQK